jgi:hypothetical protein
MPCLCDHLEPNNNELARKRAANLICYVYSRINQTPPEWAERAANHTYGDPGVNVDVGGHLCDFLRALKTADREKIIYGDPHNRTARDLADWWEDHLEQDAREERKRNLKPKFYVTLEIDQSEYVGDEDYTGINPDHLRNPEMLARLLDDGMYQITVKQVKSIK